MPRRIVLLVALFVLGGAAAMADERMLEDFGPGAGERWDYVADRVMGGVSDGGATIATVDGRRAIRLTGEVSTENNGGFIQVRRRLPEGLPAGTEGLRATVRGNGEPYYVFLRTRSLTRPWHFYSQRFPTGGAWTTVALPLGGFAPSRPHLAATPEPGEIVSIGFVAYGRDHVADLSVAEVSAY